MIRPLTTDTNDVTHAPHASTDAPMGRLSAQTLFDPQTRDLLTHRLRAVILLAGTLRPDAIQQAVSRSLLEMPVDAHRTVQTCWHEHLARLTDHLHLHHLPVRILIDRQTRPPQHWPRHNPSVAVSIERDPFELRGTGGLLRDVTLDYDDDDFVLVADAAQLLFAPLWSVLHRLGRTPGDVRLLARGDGSPAGFMLLRCGPLRHLPPVGFVDFKEQGLPRLAASFAVHVARWRARPVGCSLATPGLPLRHAPGYLHALRCWAMQLRRAAGQHADLPDWRPAFSLIEPGAAVHPHALLHDSVVLVGGRVEADAVLVRCVVGPGGYIRAAGMRTDTWIAAPRRLRRSASTPHA
ncbi:hypothetical protein ACERK3_12555 [Phycisphaerales bacterium AB-hyl4]|uniref:Uncharacterized protein n=1 Tax=Natronomicrosphaera hydrolytica TaxID=3242702 RepID=A0ABV4U688_9BACT